MTPSLLKSCPQCNGPLVDRWRRIDMVRKRIAYRRLRCCLRCQIFVETNRIAPNAKLLKRRPPKQKRRRRSLRFT